MKRTGAAPVVVGQVSFCQLPGAEMVVNSGSSAAPTAAATSVEDPLFRDYLTRALSRENGIVLDATVLRVGSSSGRELLAWQASGGRLSYGQIARSVDSLCASQLSDGACQPLSLLEPVWSVRLARLIALQNFLPNDRIVALALLEYLLGCPTPPELDRRDARLFCDLALEQGRHTLVQHLLQRFKQNRSDRLMVQADLCNPFGEDGGDVEAWLDLFNAPFRAAGLEPVSLRPPAEGADRVPFDRLYCDPGIKVYGPLVSVIVSCWHPDQQLVTSVASLLAQTWQTIEVIVVDDASPPEFGCVLDQVAAMDERVQVIRQKANRGTYVARNAALQIARGEFVTFQDSDDWSHPRRIERQAGHLLANPELIGSTGSLMRVTESLRLGLPGSPAIQEALPLFIFRRVPVIERIGFYDSVRKSADREYIERICTVFGQRIKEASKEPLGIYRLLEGSLSRAEFKPGWRHAARNIYKDAFEFWHSKIASGDASPWRSAAIVDSKFPAPRRFQIDQARLECEDAYDFVFVGDWRQYGGPQKSMIEEIHALKAAGHRIAVCQQEAFRFMTRHRHGNCMAIRQMIHDGVVDEVAMSDRLRVGVLILRYPPILQFVRHEPSAWSVSRAMIVANQAPHELDGSDVRYRVEDCIVNFRHLFGLDATWVPQGPIVREAIAAMVPSAMLETSDQPGIVDVNEWRMPLRRPSGRAPVIGRYSRDNMMKFPLDPGELLRCYPVSKDFDVRIMGGAQCVPAILGADAIPSNWTLLPYNDVPVQAFLATLDFFVYFDNDQIVEAFGRSILEALASGVVVILPEKFRRVFGEAAVYARPEEVASVVAALHADSDRYRMLSERGVEYVRTHFSRDTYARKMASWLPA